MLINKLRNYPLSLLVISTVIYLSFFKPPQVGVEEIPNIDKVIHLCMYLGLSSIFWFEFFKAHKGANYAYWKGIVWAAIFPILFSGTVELLQEYCTTYRGGDWFDFLANSVGVLLATGIAHFYVRPRLWHK